MAKSVVLHIGLMKSGTTFVQKRLFANRALLDDQGILVPGRYWANQVRAVSDLFEFTREGPVPFDGEWAALRGAIDDHPGTAIVSMEFLGPAVPQKINRVAHEFVEAEVTVVATVRDLGRNAPAMWQESIKNGHSWSWNDYLGEIEHGGPGGKHFWRQQAAGRIVQNWVDVFGRDQVHVVTVPPSGAPRELLWDRFREVAGIAPAEWSAGQTSNESLGVASTHLLRQLNERLADLEWRDYAPVVKRVLGNKVLAAHRAQEDAIGFKVPRWLTERSEDQRRRLAEIGVRVVGNLDELVPQDVLGVAPTKVEAADQLDVALVGLEGLVRDIAQKAAAERAARSESTTQAETEGDQPSL